MRANRRTRIRRKAVWTGSFNRCAYAACVLLAFSWALIHFRNDIPALILSPISSQENRDNLLNGSILIFPDFGDICRQRLIDNATWQITDNGFVDCAAATAQNAQTWGKRMSEQRTIAIRNSFVNK